jgi:hypothetical protein
MPSGSLTLAEYPADLVRLACTRCARRGRYRKDTLIARHGGETALPDLRQVIAQCSAAKTLGTACGVYFVDLAQNRE